MLFHSVSTFFQNNVVPSSKFIVLSLLFTLFPIVFVIISVENANKLYRTEKKYHEIISRTAMTFMINKIKYPFDVCLKFSKI